MSHPTDELLVEVSDGVGHIVLNRPHAINALTASMCSDIHALLEAWADDDSVRSVELSGSGTRGLCSGADVRALRDVVVAGGDYLEFFRIEYGMNAAIVDFPKPYVAHQRGIVMGGGLGVSAHGSRRIAYPDSAFAMPETIIGFVPDVGVLWHLSRAPGELGTHLALTGATVGAADAVLVGLADEVSGNADAGVLDRQRAWIDACYGAPDAATVIARLEEHPSPQARATAEELRRRCPFAVAVALAAVRRAATLGSVQEVLAQDFVLASTMIGRPDFREGVRAQLVDKDRQPRWQHDRIEDVTPDEVEAAFVPV